MVIFICVFILIFGVEENDESQTTAKVNQRLIIIDAGHGGKDGGAVASDGTQEQFLNLSIALKLEDYLKSNGYNTMLTRTDDNSLHSDGMESIREQKVSDIRNRFQIVENNQGCIFVSVHQNYYSDSKYSGTQVFYGPDNSESEALAQSIQSSVVSQLQNDNKRVIKKATSDIYLLKNTTQCAVLVECGFLSNQNELNLLKSDDYQNDLSKAVGDGIISYINKEVGKN